MKKIFINPEISTCVFAPADVIMESIEKNVAESNSGIVRTNIINVSKEYNTWKGKLNGWNE